MDGESRTEPVRYSALGSLQFTAQDILGRAVASAAWRRRRSQNLAPASHPGYFVLLSWIEEASSTGRSPVSTPCLCVSFPVAFTRLSFSLSSFCASL